jgi:hypothetical protein
MVIFGAGYGFEVLAGASWLRACSVYYWGDIDTHGFAILDQLRAHFPHVHSLLMDRATLLVHQTQWGEEAQPVLRDLPRLSAAEAAVFDDLRKGRLGHTPMNGGVRLEQERIGFTWVQQALALPSLAALTLSCLGGSEPDLQDVPIPRKKMNPSQSLDDPRLEVKSGNRENFEQFLALSPDVPPLAGDELPPVADN